MQGTKALCSDGDQSLRNKDDSYADFESNWYLNVLDLLTIHFLLNYVQQKQFLCKFSLLPVSASFIENRIKDGLLFNERFD